MDKKIVLVEDEIIIAMLLNKVFEQHGFHICKTYQNAEEAVDYVKKNEVDAVLMDIYLKGDLNGIDAAKQLNQFSNTKIIFITANAEPATKELALQTRQSGYFEKPLSDTEIDQICNIISS